MAFADALKIEIGKDNHVGLLKSRSTAEGIYTLDLDGNVTIKVCTSNVSNGKCGIWRASLSENDMLNHVSFYLDLLFLQPSGILPTRY